MTIIAKKPEGSGIKSPEGTHQAVCYAVWDLGMQKTSFEGVDKSVHKTVVAWEINERIEAPGSEYDGKRYGAFKRYTLSLWKNSNLCKDLVAWRGKKFTEKETEGFDVERVVGANCMIGLEHNDDYVNVISVIKLPKGMTKMTPENNTDAPDWVKKAQENQFIIEAARAPDTGAHSGPAAEQAVLGTGVEPKCAECGVALTRAYDIQEGLCELHQLPF